MQLFRGSADFQEKEIVKKQKNVMFEEDIGRKDKNRNKDVGHVGAFVRLIRFDQRLFPIIFPVWSA